jgi:hypothetical protein
MDSKILENCKIAVCFSGQSRTFKQCAESVNNFFTSRKGNQFIFFGHTWDSNDYTKIKQSENHVIQYETNLNIQELEQTMKELYHFENLIVEKQVTNKNQIPWASMFYSKMRVNFLKQKYEVENNMMFDLVVKCRYDLCFREGKIFEDFFNIPIEEKTLYGYYKGFMIREFFLPVPDDVIYYGSSLTMDLIDSLYTSLFTGSFLKSVGYDDHNPAYRQVGPNALISKWATMKNIRIVHNPVEYLIYRKSAENLNYKSDWDQIYQLGTAIY